jgi:hypothetical protein
MNGLVMPGLEQFRAARHPVGTFLLERRGYRDQFMIPIMQYICALYKGELLQNLIRPQTQTPRAITALPQLGSNAPRKPPNHDINNGPWECGREHLREDRDIVFLRNRTRRQLA